MKLKPWSGGGKAGYHFWCPGCRSVHGVWTQGNCTWSFDGNFEAPTFSPSILVTYNGKDADTDNAPTRICHSFVRAGHIEFLGDCTHALKGQTVTLPDIPEEWL